jgi:hypothetical protein
MTTHARLCASDAPPAREPAPSPTWIRSIGQRFAAWAKDCAHHYAAAAMYDQLSALSDAELAHRGLSRATLAHDLGAACRRDAWP